MVFAHGKIRHVTSEPGADPVQTAKSWARGSAHAPSMIAVAFWSANSMARLSMPWLWHWLHSSGSMVQNQGSKYCRLRESKFLPLLNRSAIQH